MTEENAWTGECWAANDEDFNCVSLADLLNENEDLKPGDTVYRAQAIKPDPTGYMHARDVIELLGERAWDDGGEHAGANVGHGHVLPRADGVKMRCGGPGLCSECTADASRARAALAQPSPAIATAPTYQFHSREIGESDWAPCDFSWYLYCSKSPEMDTRVVEVTAQPSPAQAEQAEPERPEVVAWQYRVTAGPQTGWSLWHPGKGEEFERSYTVERRPLMTVAQHERIVKAWIERWKAYIELSAKIAAQRDAANARLHEVATACATAEQERDAALAEVERLRESKGDPSGSFDRCMKMMYERDENAKRLEVALARVAELERQQPVAWMHDQPNRVDVIHRDVKDLLQRVPGSSRGIHRPLDVSEHYTIPLYAAPVAQAQHSVPVAREQLERLVRILDAHNYAKDAEALMALLAAAPGKEVPQAWLDVQAERRRQVEAEGWTPEHDDLYCAAELPRAAAAYILNGANDEAPAIWPFSAKWWKPRDARSNYVRASALILAEIERLDRAAPGKEGV
ncbi:hypothetical protein [Pseudomonas aeruginosa]|uniref:hypothetical protein n=2 Tax=Pseudomonas aeruginosa TaxID=287 RepID=UPI001643CBC9|nr:hypothetical protein [Pseudomonas aeruginosa]